MFYTYGPITAVTQKVHHLFLQLQCHITNVTNSLQKCLPRYSEKYKPSNKLKSLQSKERNVYKGRKVRIARPQVKHLGFINVSVNTRYVLSMEKQKCMLRLGGSEGFVHCSDGLALINGYYRIPSPVCNSYNNVE